MTGTQAHSAALRATTVLLRAANNGAWQLAISGFERIFPGDPLAARLLLDDFRVAVIAGRSARADGALRPHLQAFMDEWVERFAALIEAHVTSVDDLDQVIDAVAHFMELRPTGPWGQSQGESEEAEESEQSGHLATSPPPGPEFPTDA